MMLPIGAVVAMTRRRSIPVALLVAAFVFLPPGVRVAGAQVRIHRQLTVDGGLVQTQVNDIALDRDGFLWIGTNDGVSRFDGIGFTNYQGRDGIPPGPVYAVQPGADGAIYLATDVGMAMLRHGRPERPPASTGLLDVPIRAMAPVPGGGILFGNAGSPILLRPDGRYEKLSLGVELQRPPASLLVTRDGTVYVGTVGDGLYIHRGGRTRRLDADDGAGDFIRSLCEGRDGTVYAGTNLGVVRLRQGVVLPPARTPAARWPPDMVRAIAEGADGTLYLGTNRYGLLVARQGLAGPIETITEENGLSWNQVFAILETPEGAVYVGTDRGVSVYDHGVVKTWTAATGLPGGLVWSIAEKDGEIWLGTDGGVAVQRQEGRWEALGTELGLTHEVVRSVYPGPSGKVWAGTAGGGAVWWDGSRFHHVGRDQGLPASIVRVVREAPDGTAYLGTDGGLAILHPDGRMEIHGRGSKLPEPVVIWALEIAEDGGVWIGTMGGLVHLKNGVFKVWTERDGLPDNRIWSLRQGREGRLYIGTAHGLSIFHDGRFRNIDSRFGLSNDTIYCTVEDGAGRLYLSTNRGVNILDFSGDFEAKPRVRILTRDDGLPSIESNLGACHRDAAGRLWFGTVSGVAVYDPRREVRVKPPPRVHVTGLRLFGEEVPLGFPQAAKAPLRFDSQENYFAFSYVGIDLAAPQRVVYRYRLAGLDRGWTETDRRSVQYTNLDAGDYRFEVQARSGGGPWSAPASLSLHILAPVWQRWWFILGAILVVGGAATLLVRYRIQQLLAVERLRAAIAADLHDHIGAGLTEIAILSEIAAHRHGQAAGSSSAGMSEMGKVADIARRLVDQMNDIVWLVNPRRDSLHELFLRLKDSYAELFSHAGVLFRTSNLLLFEHVHLPMEYRQNLYLIFKEALNNSLRHSGCREIELSVALRGRHLEVVLRDDGRGFDSGGLERRGDGLDNMRRRASRIGGNLDIASAPERGTAVAFRGLLASGPGGAGKTA